MNKHFFTLATAALLLLSVPSFAQLTSSPLEPGLYDYMKKASNVTLVSDQVMTLGVSRVEYISSEQVTITAEIAKVGKVSDRMERFISEYNDHASVGTMAIDANGAVTMYQNLNPKQVNVAEMAKVIAMFDDAQRQQSALFTATLAAK